jgi:hypothetical protein
MGMETTLKSGVLISIFVICIITFAINFAIDNDSDISLSEDIRYTNLSNSLRDEDSIQFKNDSTNSLTVLEGTTLLSGDTEISGTGGQFKVGPFTAMSMTIKSLNTSFKNIFGVEFNFILVFFTGLFGLLIGYYIIKAWLGRDPN